MLCRRQARWLETLSGYDVVIEHLEGSKNSDNGQSRSPEYEIGYEWPVAQRLATLSAEPYDNFMPAIIAAPASDPLPVNAPAKLVDRPMTDSTDTGKEVSQWKVVTGMMTYKGRIYVPATDSLRGTVISQFYDNHESGHLGALETTELVSGDFYRPAMDSCVRKYVSGCEVCHRIKAPRHARYGINMHLEIGSRP